jgi:hypothetical protein
LRSDCDVLGQMLKDPSLAADCKACSCVADASVKRYKSAELIIDQWRLNGLPQIQGFIDKRAKKFPGLKVRRI